MEQRPPGKPSPSQDLVKFLNPYPRLGQFFQSFLPGAQLQGIVFVRNYHLTDWNGYKDLGYGLSVEGDGAASSSNQFPLAVEPFGYRDRFFGAFALFSNPALQTFFTTPFLQYLKSGVTNARLMNVEMPELEGESPLVKWKCKAKPKNFSFELFTQSYAGRITGGTFAGGLFGGIAGAGLMTIPQFRLMALSVMSGVRMLAVCAQRFPKITSLITSSSVGGLTGSTVGGLTGYNIFYPPTTDLKLRGTFGEDGFVNEVRIDRALCTPAPRTRTEVFYVNPRDLTRVQYFILEGGNGNPDTAVEWLTLLSQGPICQMEIKGKGFISMADFKAMGESMLGSEKIQSRITELHE